MKKFYAIVAFVLLFAQTHSQTPLNTFNKRILYKYWDPAGGASLQQTTDRGYISARTCFDSVGNQAHLYFDFVKRDREGNTSWLKRIKISDSVYNQMMWYNSEAIQTDDGGYMGATLLYRDSTHGDILLVKTDSSMNLTWAQKYTGEYACAAMRIRQAADGGYVVVGYSKDSNEQNSAFIFKIDATGNYDWGKTCGVAGDIDGCFNSAYELPGRGYVACGYSGKRSLVARFDLLGNMKWNKTFFYKGATFNKVVQVSDGNLLLGGYYADSLSSWEPRFCFLKLDTAGNILWFKGYDQHPNPYMGSYVYDIVSKQGYIAYAAYISDPIPGTLIGKMDLDGNFVWGKKYIGTYHTFGNTPMVLIATGDGGYALDEFVGTFHNGTANFSKELMKVDSLGNGACDGTGLTLSMSPVSFTVFSNALDSVQGSSITHSVTIINAQPLDSIVCETINDHAPVFVISNARVDFKLEQNYPNPFSEETVISYTLPGLASRVEFEVFDPLGVCVMNRNVDVHPGRHLVRVRGLLPGVYCYSLMVDGMRITRRMLVD